MANATFFHFNMLVQTKPRHTSDPRMQWIYCPLGHSLEISTWCYENRPGQPAKLQLCWHAKETASLCPKVHSTSYFWWSAAIFNSSKSPANQRETSMRSVLFSDMLSGSEFKHWSKCTLSHPSLPLQSDICRLKYQLTCTATTNSFRMEKLFISVQRGPASGSNKLVWLTCQNNNMAQIKLKTQLLTNPTPLN